MADTKDKTAVFRSKISIGLALFIFSIPTAILLFFIVQKMWLGGVLLLPVFILILNLYFRTWYKVSDGKLHIRSGMFFDLTLYIESVTHITKTGNIMASPALSLDRLEVKYGKSSMVLISPVDRDRFIKNLLEYNPNIIVRV